MFNAMSRSNGARPDNERTIARHLRRDEVVTISTTPALTIPRPGTAPRPAHPLGLAKATMSSSPDPKSTATNSSDTNSTATDSQDPISGPSSRGYIAAHSNVSRTTVGSWVAIDKAAEEKWTKVGCMTPEDPTYEINRNKTLKESKKNAKKLAWSALGSVAGKVRFGFGG